MKYYLKGLLFVLLITILIITNCPTNGSGGSGGGNGGGGGGKSSADSITTDTETNSNETETTTEDNDAENESTESSETSTGTVSGTVNDDATITISQSDGTTQTTATSDENSDFKFEDVPAGEATVEITVDGQTTTQTVQVNEGETTQINPFGSTQEMDNSLLAKVFVVTNKGWSTRVSDITEAQLGDEFYSKEINVPERSFSEGFPGITDRFEYFGIVYSGQIKAQYSGTYTFKITCDDGAVLWINGIKVVDGDGVHATSSYQGTINLVAGQTYEFLLKYFQGPRYHITLVLENQRPGEEMKLFNSEDY